ncbi:MAG TPA: hypothetical protein VN310_08715 [Candidatus Dormibacteraeota bacterium]|jgi:hypothetical protein|nr:hypothetical protein [Candidatus Dormibacteraeota bacterium]
MPDDQSPLGQIIDGFFALIRTLPAWLRAFVIVAILIGGGVFAYEEYFKKEAPAPPVATTAASSSTSSTAAQVTNNIILQGPAAAPPAGAPPAISVTQGGTHYTGGLSDPGNPHADNNNPQNKEAAHQAAEYDRANGYHFDHVNDENPPEQSIGTDINADNYLHYRYFEKTDKCIWINRRQAGVNHKQWIKDPLNHLHDVDIHESVELERSSKLLAESSAARSSELFPDLIPAASAQSAIPSESLLEPVQANFCVNPHPGTFTYWWGQPIDACNSPMYRKFTDGCTHYQIYNRCANSWDGRIFWTFCHPPPHG